MENCISFLGEEERRIVGLDLTEQSLPLCSQFYLFDPAFSLSTLPQGFFSEAMISQGEWIVAVNTSCPHLGRRLHTSERTFRPLNVTTHEADDIPEVQNLVFTRLHVGGPSAESFELLGQHSLD